MPFSNCSFSFWDQFGQKGFPFSQIILDNGKFLPSRSEAEKLAGLDKRKFSLVNLVPSVTSFYIRTKFRLTNRVTTVHLLQCKTNFFIHPHFWGRNLLQIQEHPSWEASISIETGFLICLHSPTFVSTCLVTRLHSSRLV